MAVYGGPINMLAKVNTAVALLMAVALAAWTGTSSGPGIEARVNLEVRRSHAQGEITNIPLLIQNSSPPDVPCHLIPLEGR